MEKKLSKAERTKIALVKLQVLLNENDIDLVYPIKMVYNFLVNDLDGGVKKQRCNHSRHSLMPMDSMFREFKNEVSPDGDFARDYINDLGAPKDGMEFLEYLVDYVDNKNALKSYFNIIQRTMDDNLNLFSERINDKNLRSEVSGYLEDEVVDELMR